MYVEYPRCPICQSSMVRCKRYSGLMKKIHSKIANISEVLYIRTGSKRQDLPKSKSIKDDNLPEQITAIVKRNNDNDRHQKLTELFVYVVNLFQNLTGRMETERDQLLKTIYEHVEKTNSIFFTRQQWSDLENEYNRLMLIDQFREKKELAEPDLYNAKIDILDDMLFGPNPFSNFACQICNSLLNPDSDNNDKWTTILPDGNEWNDFEMDRRICDGKWIVCPKGKEMN